ncbi:MAG: hypothetical protein ABIJ92_00425 [Candidatus Aenigmatarchaeota archaeon]
MPKLDLTEVGLEVAHDVRKAVANLPVDERGQLVNDRGGDQTKRIDKVASDAAHSRLDTIGKVHGIKIILFDEEEPSEDIQLGYPSGGIRVYGSLDPIDASWNAVTGIPFFSTLQAYTQPTDKDVSDLTFRDFYAGIVSEIETMRERTWMGRVGEQSFKQDRRSNTIQKLVTTAITDPAQLRIILDSYTAEDRELCEKLFLPLRLGFKDSGRLYGFGLEAMASVNPEGIEPGYAGAVAMNAKIENTIGPRIIFEAAGPNGKGGITSDYGGNLLDAYQFRGRSPHPNVVFAANPEIHKYIIEQIRQARINL